MTNRHRLWVEHDGGTIAVARWGDASSDKPPALLVHGTGFVAEVWEEVANALAANYTVYGIDRRGHGASHKPAADRYHFLDFASDVCAVVEALELTNIFGIGHSAGATDLPRMARAAGAALSDKGVAAVRGTLRRQPEFDSVITAFTRYRAAPAFADWSEDALWSYVQHGFETLPDGRVRLLCRPDIEAAMLRPIFEAIEQVYAGDERGNPFASLAGIDRPVRVATAEKSWAIYKEMAARAVALIPAASQWTFDGVGHCVAQEAPELLLQALAAFEVGAV